MTVLHGLVPKKFPRRIKLRVYTAYIEKSRLCINLLYIDKVFPISINFNDPSGLARLFSQGNIIIKRLINSMFRKSYLY